MSTIQLRLPHFLLHRDERGSKEEEDGGRGRGGKGMGRVVYFQKGSKAAPVLCKGPRQDV